MSDVMFENLTDTCKRLEAFETPRWAIEAVLDVELTTRMIVDPCAGTGIIMEVCEEHGLNTVGVDIFNWEDRLTLRAMRNYGGHIRFTDFLSIENTPDLFIEDRTVIMNPPFSLACQFVDKARDLGARKIICFQRQAWRESGDRRAWWETHPPARIWVCGARASCWRFDLLDCQHDGGLDMCPNRKRRGKRHDTQGCRHCMGGVPTSHAWYVWERGHKGAEVTSAIYPREVA